MNTKYSNKIECHIVGHIYEDTLGKLYMFLGKGFYDYNNWEKCCLGYVYLRIYESKKYFKNIKNFSDVIKNMTNNYIASAEHISVLEKPKNFVKDLGVIKHFNDDELSNTYYQKFQSKNSSYVYECTLNLTENKNNILSDVDNFVICDLEKIINDRKNKNKRKKFESLKKCPFCDNSNITINNINQTESFVGCKICDIGFTDKTDKAIIKWNTRFGKYKL